MEPLKIVLGSIIAAVAYGILHDQVTARICVEYFTIGHPPIFHTSSPTLLALGWGIIATWWVGVILGIQIVCAARLGDKPKLTAKELLRHIGILLLCTAACSLIAGITGYVLASKGAVWLLEPMHSAVPRDKHIAFLTDLWAHLAAYGAGFLGGIILCICIWRRRKRMKSLTAEVAGT